MIAAERGKQGLKIHYHFNTLYEISTVGQPATMVPPCAVLSPIRAAGLPPISTFVLPMMTESGGPTHTAIEPIVAAGIPPISTVGVPGVVTGPPTCGIGGKPGVTIGQTCISPTRAAGCPISNLPRQRAT